MSQIVTIIFNAVSGDILRAGRLVNPESNVQPGEDWINAALDNDPFLYKVDVPSRQLVPRTDLIKPVTWEDIRLTRDLLLSRSDFTQLPDAPLTEIEVDTARSYRQALRELTEVYLNPEDVIFPTKPSFIP